MKLTPDKVSIAVKAYTGGLTIKEIAVDFLKIGERTLYYWIAQGRKNYIRVEMAEIRKEDLPFTEQLKLELFEGMKAGDYGETPDELHERLNNRIDEIAFEQEEKTESRQRRRNNETSPGKENPPESTFEQNEFTEVRMFQDSAEKMEERRRKLRFKNRGK